MDKSGVMLVLMLGTLAALVVSILLIEAERTVMPPGDGTLIPPVNLDQTP